MYLHFIGAIILGAQCCRDGHHHSRAPVAEDVKVAVQEAFVVDDANHDQVQMDALDAHPGKGCEEEIVQQPCNNRAEKLPRDRQKNEEMERDLDNF